MPTKAPNSNEKKILKADCMTQILQCDVQASGALPHLAAIAFGHV